jgi:histidinol-phosphate aminotransferase
LLDAVRQPNVGAAWLCSPSNPTGRLLDTDLVRAVLESAPDVLVCIDEAYYEISGQTLLPLALEFPNAVVVRTFSKGYGLAGARVGYLIGHPDVTRTIESVRLPQNLTTFGIAAACRALADQEGLKERVAALIGERERFGSELERRGWQLVPSHGNFLLTRPPAGDAEAVATWLQGAGLIVRSYGGHPRLNEWLRIAIRSPEEDDRLLRRLDARP